MLRTNEFIVPEKDLSLRRKIDIAIKKEVVSVATKEVVRCNCCNGTDLNKNVFHHSENYQCVDCGYVFLKHNESIKTDGIQKNLDPNKFLRPALSWLPQKTLKVLEVGCHCPDILEELRKRNHEVDSIDPMGFNEKSFQKGEFDLVFAFNAFRNSEQPLQLARKLFSHLKDEGLLVIYGDLNNAEELFHGESSTGCSFFTFDAFDAIIGKLKHTIIYTNPQVIIARKEH